MYDRQTCRQSELYIVLYSVSDPFHFDMDPDPDPAPNPT